ncbi:MAG: F-box protein [Parachlamydiaceae bacterium]|nr:F-box protein [Parachlamydiaceae bacterium]
MISQLNLFFFTVIKDKREIPLDQSFKSMISRWLEKKANSYLKEYLFWTKGKKIIIIDNEIIIKKVKNKFNSRIIKIQSLIKFIFYSFFGILFKATAWMIDYSNILRRNQEIIQDVFFKSLHETSKKAAASYSKIHIRDNRIFDLSNPIIKKPQDVVLNLGEIDQDKKSLIFEIPEEIRWYILTFLNVKDIFNFALTCKSNFLSSADYTLNNKNIFYYSKPIINALGNDKINTLPVIEFRFEILPLNDTIDCLVTDNTEINQDEIEFLEIINKKNYLNKLSVLMEDYPIKKIQLLNNEGVIFQIKDNIKNETQIFIISKSGKKSDINVYDLSCQGVCCFLNDLRLHENVPLIDSYLKRLFNGEPCGNFLENFKELNLKDSSIKISELIEEGPRLLEDGKTTVIQLWPSI